MGGGDFYQKLPLRPREGTCERIDIEYDTVFDDRVRQVCHAAFAPIPPLSLRPDAPVGPVVATAPPSVAKAVTQEKNVTEPEVAPVETAASAHSAAEGRIMAK